MYNNYIQEQLSGIVDNPNRHFKPQVIALYGEECDDHVETFAQQLWEISGSTASSPIETFYAKPNNKYDLIKCVRNGARVIQIENFMNRNDKYIRNIIKLIDFGCIELASTKPQTFIFLTTSLTSHKNRKLLEYSNYILDNNHDHKHALDKLEHEIFCTPNLSYIRERCVLSLFTYNQPVNHYSTTRLSLILLVTSVSILLFFIS